MFIDYRHHYTSPLHKALAMTIAPLQYFVNAPVKIFDEINLSLASRKTLMNDEAKLRAENLLLKAQVQKFLALQAENIHLKNLLNAQDKSGLKLLVAELLAVDANPFAHEAILDKGSRQGVYLGQPVLDAYGIMGQVIAVTPYTSRLLFISDKRSGVPVEDTRSGVRAIADGTGSAVNLTVENVPETSDVKVGDVLTSSGMGQRYPVGYPVAVVTTVIHNPDDLFAHITAKPFAQLNRSREVILVWPTKQVPSDVLLKQLMAMDKDQKSEGSPK